MDYSLADKKLKNGGKIRDKNKNILVLIFCFIITVPEFPEEAHLYTFYVAGRNGGPSFKK